MTWRRIDSPIGPLVLAGEDDVLTSVEPLDGPEGLGDGGDGGDPTAFPEAADQLRAFFEGGLRAFDVPILLHGTPFQLRVWAALRAIPYGETVSYGKVAVELGQPTAARAVGLATGRNPVAVIVPCHRVIGASGTLTGYRGGLARKQWLLDHERRQLQESSVR